VKLHKLDIDVAARSSTLAISLICLQKTSTQEFDDGAKFKNIVTFVVEFSSIGLRI